MKLLLVFILALVVCKVGALECYYCNPNNGISCVSPTTVNCKGSCGKEMYRGMTERGCYEEGTIDTFHEDECFSGPNGEWFCTCNSNKCNSASRQVLGASFVFFAFALIFMLKH